MTYCISADRESVVDKHKPTTDDIVLPKVYQDKLLGDIHFTKWRDRLVIGHSKLKPYYFWGKTWSCFDMLKEGTKISAGEDCELSIETPSDNHVSPKHYRKGKIEPWDFIASQRLNFFEGNIVKYITRHKHKDGLKDLHKARTYLNKLISEVELCQE